MFLNMSLICWRNDFSSVTYSKHYVFQKNGVTFWEKIAAKINLISNCHETSQKYAKKIYNTFKPIVHTEKKGYLPKITMEVK